MSKGNPDKNTMLFHIICYEKFTSGSPCEATNSNEWFCHHFGGFVMLKRKCGAKSVTTCVTLLLRSRSFELAADFCIV